MAIQRIWRQHGLLKKRRRKYRRKQDLARFKIYKSQLQVIEKS